MDLYHRMWMGDRGHDVGAYVELACDTLTNPEVMPYEFARPKSGKQVTGAVATPSSGATPPPSPSSSGADTAFFCMSGFISDVAQVVEKYNHDQLASAREKEQEFRKYERMQRMQVMG